MYDYISVFAPDETYFSHNGLRILVPTSCEITEVLNGEYSLTITHPHDEWGNWKYIRENYIIKAQGQLFRIYRKSLSMSADGNYEVKADAMHIFYDLNYYFIRDTRPMMQTGSDALNWIVTHTYTDRGSSTADQPAERFLFSTDIKPSGEFPSADDLKTAYYEKMSVTKALIGADNCFITVWGGELLRDNFNVVINRRRGEDNAFSIRYGFDMTEIQQEVDYSNYCSTIYYEATIYNESIVNNEKQRNETVLTGTASLNTLDMAVLPVPPMQFYSFEINIKDIKRIVKGTVKKITDLPVEGNSMGDIYYVEKLADGTGAYYVWANTSLSESPQWTLSEIPTIAEMKTACEERAKEYMLINCQPSINYRVSFADLKNYDLYKSFIGLQECNLGDIGTIYHELLGINTTQQIVKKTIDGITGEAIGIELGSLRKSFTSDGRINGGINSVQSELIKNEIAAENTWENLGNLGYEMQDLNLSWTELTGNPIVGGVD